MFLIKITKIDPFTYSLQQLFIEYIPNTFAKYCSLKKKILLLKLSLYSLAENQTCQQFNQYSLLNSYYDKCVIEVQFKKEESTFSTEANRDPY